MRNGWPLALALALASPVNARSLCINEVLCAHAAGGRDWIELYNAGSRPVDLQGFTVAIAGAFHRIEASWVVPPNGFLLLWCDRRMTEGPTHLDLKLERTGGTALLIAPDRSTVVDLFTWPSLPDEVSIGRLQDGRTAWGFFEQPTPGMSNTGALAASRCLRPPSITEANGSITIGSPDDAEIHYTTDGTAPTLDAPRYAAAIPVAEARVVRARAFRAGAIPSAEAVHAPVQDGEVLSLVVDPHDLWDPESGLLAGDNFARSGPDRSRPAWISGLSENATEAMPVGIAIAGSGSRSRPKKNFKLFARDRFGSPGPFAVPTGGSNDELLLRADATPDAFLRNLFMEHIAARSGAHVDVQPSRARPLYLNGAYWGLYRTMPAKNAEWLGQWAGAAAIDLADGPGGHMLHGKAARHARMVDALVRGAPLDTLALLIDLSSLIDLACFDLWTGRADHDLNVRCWRPRTAEGRWRWILYDMDLWASVKDNTVGRMCSATAPETPYVPQCLAHPALRDRLLARLSALLATTLSSEQALPLADSLFQAHAAWMQADHERWQAEMPMPTPDESLAHLREHVQGRADPLLQQLAKYTGRTLRTLTIATEPAQAGTIRVEGLPLTTDRAVMRAFAGTPLTLTAVPAPGMEFAGWKGANDGDPVLRVDPANAKHVTARFRPVGLSRQHGLQQGGE